MAVEEVVVVVLVAQASISVSEIMTMNMLQSIFPNFCGFFSIKI